MLALGEAAAEVAIYMGYIGRLSEAKEKEKKKVEKRVVGESWIIEGGKGGKEGREGREGRWEGRKEGRKDRQTARQTDRRTDRRTDSLTNRQTGSARCASPLGFKL